MIITLIFIILLIITLINYYKKSTKTNTISLITNIITFLETFIITKLIINIFGNNIVNKITSLLKSTLKISKEEYKNITFLDDSIKFITLVLMSLIIYYILYLITYIINHIIITIKNKKNIEEQNKIINIVLGLLSFITISFSILFPISGISKIYNTSLNEINYTSPKLTNKITSSPIIKAYENTISIKLFDKLTEYNDFKKIKTSRELQGLTTIIYVINDIQTENNKKHFEKIKEELENTYLLSNLITEISKNAATNWKNNKPFLGETLKIPTDNRKMIYIKSLEIISNWKRENLINDISTVFEVYEILEKNDLTKKHTSKYLLQNLKNEKFTTELFLSLFKNNDFRELLPTIMNFGLTEILEQVNITVEDTYINTVDLNNLTEEDIKKEAKVFSLVINEIYNIKTNNFTYEDLNKLETNLKNIKESKIINDLIYNLILKLAQNKILNL